MLVPVIKWRPGKMSDNTGGYDRDQRSVARIAAITVNTVNSMIPLENEHRAPLPHPTPPPRASKLKTRKFAWRCVNADTRVVRGSEEEMVECMHEARMRCLCSGCPRVCDRSVRAFKRKTVRLISVCACVRVC